MVHALTSVDWKVVVKDGEKHWEVLKISRSATSMILTQRIASTISAHVTRHQREPDHHHAQIILGGNNEESLISEEQNTFIPANYLSNVTFEFYHALPINYENLDKRFIPHKNKKKENPIVVDVKDYENPQKVIECGVFLVSPDHYGRFYEMLKDFQKVKLVPKKEFSPHVVFGFWQPQQSLQD
jgi:hypothetical protein